MKIAFGLQAGESESLTLTAQRMVNVYLQESPAGATNPIAIVRAAGIKSFGTVDTAGAFRGSKTMRGELYVVHTSNLYRVAGSGVATLLGSIPGTTRCSMSTNGTQLSISNGSMLYVYNRTTGVLAAVSDPDFPGSTYTDFLDGYTIFGEPNSGRFWITAINDSTDINALDFLTSEAKPSDTIAGIVNHREFFAFSEEDFEVYWNSGNADFPLERTGNGYGEIGCAGQFALCGQDNTIYFLGSDGIFYRLEGYTPIRVSTHSVERKFKTRTLSDAVVESWKERGHAFVSVRFSDLSLIYDVATKLWHERKSYGMDRWQPDFIIKAYKKTLIGASGVIGELDDDTYTEFGEPQVATCASISISDGNNFIEHDRLDLIFEMGVGLSTGQGSDPTITLRWSDDGGQEWVGQQSASLGAIGNRKARAVFTRLSRALNRVYEWSVSDPVKLWFLEARLNEF